jgi:hypothetical protein
LVAARARQATRTGTGPPSGGAALGELVDVVDHGAETLEARLDRRVLGVLRQLLQGVQHGGNRAVLVADGLDGVVHDFS